MTLMFYKCEMWMLCSPDLQPVSSDEAFLVVFVRPPAWAFGLFVEFMHMAPTNLTRLLFVA